MTTRYFRGINELAGGEWKWQDGEMFVRTNGDWIPSVLIIHGLESHTLFQEVDADGDPIEDAFQKSLSKQDHADIRGEANRDVKHEAES